MPQMPQLGMMPQLGQIEKAMTFLNPIEGWPGLQTISDTFSTEAQDAYMLEE